MNCKKAKQIDIVSYLKKQGYEIQKTQGKNKWFLSPFRGEKTSSFKVDVEKNIWYDFGEGLGGTIIDLVQKLECCSVTEALEKLSNDIFYFHQQPKEISKPKKHTILEVKKLTNKYLITYLEDRKLNLEFALQFCSEVYYSFDSNKTYYAIGFKNDLNGYELRNNFFKGCLGRKAITLIKGGFCIVSVFESWSDFLSYLTLKKKIPKEDFIILNSTALVKSAIGFTNGYTQIKTFLDNDMAGDKAFKIIKESTKKEIFDCRKHYSNFKDLNDFLVNTVKK